MYWPLPTKKRHKWESTNEQLYGFWYAWETQFIWCERNREIVYFLTIKSFSKLNLFFLCTAQHKSLFFIFSVIRNSQSLQIFGQTRRYQVLSRNKVWKKKRNKIFNFFRDFVKRSLRDQMFIFSPVFTVFPIFSQK